MAALGHLGETVCQVLRGVNIPHLLDRLLLLNALPQLYYVRVQPVVLRGRFEVVDVAEQTLVVGESDTLKKLDPGTTHLFEGSSDEVYGAEHLLHGNGFGGTAAVDHTLDLLAGPMDDRSCHGLLVEDHHYVPTHCKKVARGSV